MMTGMAHKGMMYLRSALSIALGSGVVIGGSYLASRIRERHDMESRLDRLEQMLEQVSNIEAEKAKEAEKPKTRPRARQASKSK